MAGKQQPQEPSGLSDAQLSKLQQKHPPTGQQPQVVPKILEALNRGSEAGTALAQRGFGAGFQTLLHSESQQQYEKDTADLSRRMQGLSEAEYAKRPGFERQANELAVQILLDPTTYIGGGGLARRAIETGGEHMLPAVLRAMEKMGSHPSPLGQAAKAVSAIGTKAHNQMMGGGEAAAHALRTLALQQGREGVQEFHRLYSLRGATESLAPQLEQTLNNAFDRALKNVDRDDRMKIFNALNTNSINKLPQELQGAAQQISAYQKGIKYLNGFKTTRAALDKAGYKLPADLQRFAAPEALNAMKLEKAHMARHIPLPSEFHPKDMKDLMARTSDALQKAGKLPKGQLFDEPELIEDFYRSHFAKAAQDLKEGTAAQRLRTELGYGKNIPSHIEDMFKPERGTEIAGNLGKVVRGAARTADISKAAMFYSPFGHMARIGTLTAAHSPTAFLKAIGKYAKMGAGFGDVAGVTGEAARYGATGVHNVEQSRLEESLSKFGPIGNAIGKYYKNVGKMLWGWDEASKAALFDEYKKLYKDDPLRAAYHVQQDLVNYGAQSPFIRGAGRVLSTFPTWRTRMPIAVARAIAKHPHVATNLARTAPWMFGQSFNMGGQQEQFRGSALTEGTEAMGGGTDDLRKSAAKYIKGSLRPGARTAAALATALFAGRPEEAKGWTGGEPIGSYFLSHELPFAASAMSATGKGPGGEGDPQDEALYSILNLAKVPPKKRASMHLPRPKLPRPGAKKKTGLWF